MAKKKKRSLSDIYRQRHLPKQLREKDTILHGAAKEIESLEKLKTPATRDVEKQSGFPSDITNKQKAAAKLAKLLMRKKK